MLKMKIGDKQLIIEDGAEVIVDGDEIRVKPIYIPLFVPWSPYQPIYSTPWTLTPHTWPGTTTDAPQITWGSNPPIDSGEWAFWNISGKTQ